MLWVWFVEFTEFTCLYSLLLNEYLELFKFTDTLDLDPLNFPILEILGTHGWWKSLFSFQFLIWVIRIDQILLLYTSCFHEPWNLFNSCNSMNSWNVMSWFIHWIHKFIYFYNTNFILYSFYNSIFIPIVGGPNSGHLKKVGLTF